MLKRSGQSPFARQCFFRQPAKRKYHQNDLNPCYYSFVTCSM